MGSLLEITTVDNCRVFLEENADSERGYFSAYVQLPGNAQFIIDDRQLPRLKRRIREVLAVMSLQERLSYYQFSAT